MNTGRKNKIWGSGMDVYGTVCGSQEEGCEHDHETWGLSAYQRGLCSVKESVKPTVLTLNLLTTTIVAPPSNASKWQMGFNSAFKGLKKTCANSKSEGQLK